MSTASQISHGALDRAGVLGTVAQMSAPAPRSDGGRVPRRRGVMERGVPVLWDPMNSPRVLPLDQILLPHAIPSSIPSACLGCWQHQDFYTSRHLFLNILCFKTQVSVAVTDVSASR